jgi:hypothetical protein
MVLYDLVKTLVVEVDKINGDYRSKEKLEEITEYILEHSIVEYKANTLNMKSFTMIGVKQGKNIDVQIPRFLTFEISEDRKDWKLLTHNNLGDLEYRIKNSEEIIVALIDGVIKHFNLIYGSFNNNIIWKNPIFRMEFKKNNKNMSLPIHELYQAEEEIIKKIEEVEDIKIYDLVNSKYLDFYVMGTIYSTDGGETDLIINWGLTEPKSEDLEYIWG